MNDLLIIAIHSKAACSQPNKSLVDLQWQILFQRTYSLGFSQDTVKGGKQVRVREKKPCHRALLLTACVKIIFQVYFKNSLFAYVWRDMHTDLLPSQILHDFGLFPPSTFHLHWAGTVAQYMKRAAQALK